MKSIAISFLLMISSCMAVSPESANYRRVAGVVNKQIREEIPLSDDGPGAMIPDKIHAYTTIFHHDGPIPITLARCYALRMTQIVLDKFNSDQSIQGYLESRPFTIKNVSFAIFSNSRHEIEAPENYTDFVSFSFGEISYDRYDKNLGKTTLIFSETYEEALQRCSSINQSTQ